MLFQEEGKRWETTWEDNEALAQWIAQVQQIIKTYVQNQQWEGACILFQQGPSSMLMKMKFEVAMIQWPTIMGTEAQARHLWDSSGPSKYWEILDEKHDL